MEQYVSAVLGLLLFWLLFGAFRARKRRVVGPAAGAMMHEMLSNDRRAAIEVIVEERAAAHDAEDRDGNLPDLEAPRGSGQRRDKR